MTSGLEVPAGFCGSLGTPGLCGTSHPIPKGQSPALSGAVYLQIREEIDHYGIRIYQFPECDSDEDEEFKLQDQALKVSLAPPAPSLEEQSPMAERPPSSWETLGTVWGHISPPAAWWGWDILHYPDVSSRPRGLMGRGWDGETRVPAGALHSQGLWDISANGCCMRLRKCVGKDTGHSGEEGTLLTLTILLQESIPFAVIGSNTVVEAKGRRVRGRLYPWGIVEGNAGPCPTSPGGTGTLCAPHLHAGGAQGDVGGWRWPPDPGFPCSGEPVPLRLREAADDAGEDPHAGPQGRDAGNPLRELPHAVHPEHDPHGGEGEEPQVRGRERGASRGGVGGASPLSGVTPTHCEW